MINKKLKLLVLCFLLGTSMAPAEWTKYNNLNEFQKKEFDNIKEFFKVKSYEEFTKKYNANSLTKQEEAILQNASRRACFEEQKTIIVKKEIQPVFNLINRIKNTNAFNSLVLFVKQNINDLKKGQQVNFEQMFKNISKNMKIENNNKAGKKYHQSDIDLMENNVLKNMKIKQLLIGAIISTVDKDLEYNISFSLNSGYTPQIKSKNKTFALEMDMDSNVQLAILTENLWETLS